MTTCTCGRRQHYMIRRFPQHPSQARPGWDDYPWYVQETTHGNDLDDYGSVETFDRALDVVRYMRTHPTCEEVSTF